MENLKSPVLRGIDTRNLFSVYVEKLRSEHVGALLDRTDKILDDHNLKVVIGVVTRNETEWDDMKPVVGIRMWFEKEEDAMLFKLSI